MRLFVLSCAVLAAALLPAGHVRAADAPACHAGAYRLLDGSVVEIGRLGEPAQLRWRRVDGTTGLLSLADDAWRSTTGWTGRADGKVVRFGDCAEARIDFDGQAGSKIAFDITETRFAGKGEQLRGRLVLPPGDGPVPIAVIVHGSEDYSGVDFYSAQHLFPAQGVGVFVYDKRGTGQSTGKYTQDFHLLSDDAVAALAEARRLAGPRAARTGFLGGSQAGWIAPLAASKTGDAAFVVVGYGMADSPLAEDRDQVMLDLRRAGYGDDVMAKAREITDATGAVVASRREADWERLEALRRRHAGEPWYPKIKGEFSGLLLQHTREQIEATAAQHDKGTTWNYDPLPVLRALRIPQLWILAGADREAPPEETRRRLVALAEAGHPITTVVFPDTDHGIREFETGRDDSRTYTRVADGYQRMQVDWILTGTLPHAPYGRARLLAQPGR
jgi:dienelactone hydrolase